MYNVVSPISSFSFLLIITASKPSSGSIYSQQASGGSRLHSSQCKAIIAKSLKSTKQSPVRSAEGQSARAKLPEIVITTKEIRIDELFHRIFCSSNYSLHFVLISAQQLS